MRRFRITVEGVAYDVSVEELDGPAAEPAPAAYPAPYPVGSAAPATGEHLRPPAAARLDARPATPGDVVSPLAGVVVSVGVAAGGRVEAGQPLLVLEAMKMQTTISAPHSGTVAAIAVTAGASVQEGQVLMSLR
ncbi:MAG TPA: biotin/lipoyl-containing protein [Azospirillum sp.]